MLFQETAPLMTTYAVMILVCPAGGYPQIQVSSLKIVYILNTIKTIAILIPIESFMLQYLWTSLSILGFIQLKYNLLQFILDELHFSANIEFS